MRVYSLFQALFGYYVKQGSANARKNDGRYKKGKAYFIGYFHPISSSLIAVDDTCKP
jgi:hypothetical protein